MLQLASIVTAVLGVAFVGCLLFLALAYLTDDASDSSSEKAADEQSRRAVGSRAAAARSTNGASNQIRRQGDVLSPPEPLEGPHAALHGRLRALRRENRASDDAA